MTQIQELQPRTSPTNDLCETSSIQIYGAMWTPHQWRFAGVLAAYEALKSPLFQSELSRESGHSKKCTRCFSIFTAFLDVLYRGSLKTGYATVVTAIRFYKAVDSYYAETGKRKASTKRTASSQSRLRRTPASRPSVGQIRHADNQSRYAKMSFESGERGNSL